MHNRGRDHDGEYDFDDDSTCLSIIYRVPGGGDSKGPHRFETLALIVVEKEDFSALVNTLYDLLVLHEEEQKQCDQNFLFLRFHWMELGKAVMDRLSVSEWIRLCDRMNVPVKKSLIVQHYEEFLGDMQAEDGLTILQTSHLLDEVREIALAMNDLNADDDPCVRIFNDILKSDPVPALNMEHETDDVDVEMEINQEEASISAVAFLSFVRSEQKEYNTSIEDVHHSLVILNGQITAEMESSQSPPPTDEYSSERMSRSKFIAYLTSDSNDLMDPQMGEEGYEEMTFPLSHYWINTSHDTYLACLSESFRGPKSRENLANARTTDVQMYTTALLRGIRALELRTWDGFFEYQGPVVARRKPTSGNTIMFADVLRAVRSFLASTPDSLPVLLCIENHCSLTNQETMARELSEILGESDLLYMPPDDVDAAYLPSPEALRGKVVIKGKRPKIIKPGATVMNNDFDDDINVADDDAMLQDVLGDEEDDEDEETVGVVVSFEASGPVRSTSRDTIKISPTKLLEMSRNALEEARLEADKAKNRAKEMNEAADLAEERAAELASAAGLTMSQVKALARGDADEEGTVVDLPMLRQRLPEDAEISKPREVSDGESVSETEAGVEMHEVFEKSMEGARADCAIADSELLQALDLVARKSLRLQDALDGLNQAQIDLASSYEREKDTEAAALRATADARLSLQHAETARQRVETVREMLRNIKNSATSAETVVHTAMTEAKISDQRASETEARAKRAAANAEKDRARAELETEKEERLEHETAELHDQSVIATNLARIAREKMEKAASHIDKVNEQIKLIETSSQYRKEMSEGGDSPRKDDDSSERKPWHVSRFVAKHAAKLQQKEEGVKAMKEASDENAEAEKKRRIAQEAFEEKARMWKMQADIASKARKQADRSAAILEELEEHAAEEREAAKLRKAAHEKATSNVKESDSYRASVQSQLMEAERASAEAASLAVENRKRAENLSREAADAKDHSIALATLEARKAQHKEALCDYDAAMERQKKAEAKVAEAKLVLDRSSDLVMIGKRSAAAEIQRVNAEKLAERNAAFAYNKAVLSRKQAAHSLSLAKLAETTFDERKAAFSHARDYKEKHDKIDHISVDLATMTLLDSHKFKYWEKSLTLPCTQMHSFSQGLVLNMLDLDVQVNRLLKFSRNHIVRTFPSETATKHMRNVNHNPVSQWAAGCQLVSMNFHCADEHLLVNDGRFRMNGSSGYVLKPSFLLKDNQPDEKRQHWKFEILSGRCLPKGESAGRRVLPAGLSASSHVNPVVRVTLYDGVPGKDSSKVVFTSKPAERNGLNPVWETGKDFGILVERPSIAVLLFAVWDRRGDGFMDFIAGAAMPVCCLREGYRTVSLFDSLHTKCGPYSFASLLVRAQKLS